MFESFRKTRAASAFKARSAGRDVETDLARLRPVFNSIEAAIRSAEAEFTGLTRRVDDVLARASMTVGSGTDEYLSREDLDSRLLDRLDVEIANGQRRLGELSTNIAHFKSLKADLTTRFPGFRSSQVQ
jgi:hypothetical protein